MSTEKESRMFPQGVQWLLSSSSTLAQCPSSTGHKSRRCHTLPRQWQCHSFLWWQCFLTLPALFTHRHHGADRIHRRAGCGLPRERLCHLGTQEFEVPADPAHDPHGPARRHLEAPGLSGLRTQQGEQDPGKHVELCALPTRHCFGSTLHPKVLPTLGRLEGHCM